MSFQAGRDDRAAGEMPAARVVGFRLGQRGRRARRRVGTVGRRVRGLAAIRAAGATRTARATAVLIARLAVAEPFTSRGVRRPIGRRLPARSRRRAGRRIRAGGRDDRGAAGDEQCCRHPGGEKGPTERIRVRRRLGRDGILDGRWRLRPARGLVIPIACASPVSAGSCGWGHDTVRPSPPRSGHAGRSWESVEPVGGETGAGHHQDQASGSEPLGDLLGLVADTHA